MIGRYQELGDEGSGPIESAGFVADAVRPRSRDRSSSCARTHRLRRRAGADTIHYHLTRRHRRGRRAVPSVATIWRVLTRRGFIAPQPHKRPKSGRRFQAELPKVLEGRHHPWVLAYGSDVEILNVIDDHSRLLVASRAFMTAKAADVVETFHLGVSSSSACDMRPKTAPSSPPTSRNGTCAIELKLLALGVDYKHSRPYHPQTCGKVERFHQTLKKWLAKQPPPDAIAALQAQLDKFATYYNTVRPHRALGRRTPAQAFAAGPKQPHGSPPSRPVRTPSARDRVDKAGRSPCATGRSSCTWASGAATSATRHVLVADRDVRVINSDGELLAKSPSTPQRPTKHRNGPDNNPSVVRDVTRHPSGMSRDTTAAPLGGFEPPAFGLEGLQH